ncbi:major facilitator superfamily domain-containing protein [Irpex rosettiformis]|uniref:Major facilitator superfamily domain-containing protein n=1 Tax=Irpex rosettiformis TaxID=378272 RepID=A0ACB8UFR3_9APHY|nr:major facilitator superfamily domain-containing protein [Irpex rosettiformis]
MTSTTPEYADVEKGSATTLSHQPHSEIPAEKTTTTPHDPHEVFLSPEEDPKVLPLWRRWLAASIVILGAICVTGSSSIAATVETGVSEYLHVSNEVSTLSVTLFVLGMGVGPMVIGPLAGILGQRVIYIFSFVFLFAFNFPVEFSHSLAVHLVFRFLGGLAGSAFLSLGGATISDLFNDEEVGTPMAAFTIGTFVGPVITPVWGGFVYQRAGWRWAYHVFTIWEFVQTLLLIIGVPETNVQVIVRRKAVRLRKTSGDNRYYAAVEREDRGSVFKDIGTRALKIVELTFYDRMILLLDIWCSLVLGILYLVFQVFPIIFAGKHHFDSEQVGLAFIGVLVGLAIAMASQYWWNKFRRHIAEKYTCDAPPEVWLTMGKLGGILVPISLYCLAFTTYAHVHRIAPIISTIPFGTGMCYIFTSTFTYLTVAYRHLAAEALTSNAVMRTLFAGAFPLFSTAMYNRLGTDGATALLAGLMTVMAPLPFVFARVGERLRAKSAYAYKSSPTPLTDS